MGRVFREARIGEEGRREGGGSTPNQTQHRAWVGTVGDEREGGAGGEGRREESGEGGGGRGERRVGEKECRGQHANSEFPGLVWRGGKGMGKGGRQ